MLFILTLSKAGFKHLLRYTGKLFAYIMGHSLLGQNLLVLVPWFTSFFRKAKLSDPFPRFRFVKVEVILPIRVSAQLYLCRCAF